MKFTHASVIPACFWRESRKTSLEARTHGYDEKTLIQNDGIKSFQTGHRGAIYEPVGTMAGVVCMALCTNRPRKWKSP